MLKPAAESDIDDVDESELGDVDDDSPSDNADGQKFKYRAIDRLMTSDLLGCIVKRFEQQMLVIGPSK
ncbi:hypothetical protein S40285_10235 [Stachybotrys chlorohalonatus IBT 40285]|jgi:hypothetical protein|uniref:Uncharacterized protein n=1 Tax=Stachybotrys chlorohalonatus (strain IBT 40285) TaxID=1283841 RepID=A0A084QZU2_STAC4|nr:hypothetical protein S40285_10235 [Stachybotrys chlorohalonata IBT 40285]